MVRKNSENADAYTVTGIIDWEDSGFYPEYYECTTLSNAQSIDVDDDWYLHVPDFQRRPSRDSRGRITLVARGSRGLSSPSWLIIKQKTQPAKAQYVITKTSMQR
ncbi:hypothetical protein ACJ73_08657 [Blastomyces percursus]|uniref:Uncharacterized protein n=1 Tax=Blastomyces percursus TaxID=1658174 RepID=A0A1J9PSJ9_9EURO|nr:hypothetical protein ACJ73_08657 [Blastomyces percursus]